MARKSLFLIVGALILLLTGQSPGVSEQGEAGPGKRLADKVSVEAPVSRDYCQLSGFDGTIGWIDEYYSGWGTVQRFDADDCGASASYPFEIKSMWFTLYDTDDGLMESWPIQVDIVVYSYFGSCEDMWNEKCRFTVLLDSSLYKFPNLGVVYFPEPCCVEDRFLIGIEYTDPRPGLFPSIIFDDKQTMDTCSQFKCVNGVWYEWYEYYGLADVGSPAWWVRGETNSIWCNEFGIWWKQPRGIYMPDFDQNQDAWANYCGPAATANCLWWFDRRFPHWNLVPDGMTAPEFIEDLGALMSTNIDPPAGTYIDSLQSGVNQWLALQGAEQFLAETTVYAPTFDYCREQLLDCQDVILLLGFWECVQIVPDVPEPGCFELHWNRTGGHYVTMAGVDSTGYQVAISDPDKDAAYDTTVMVPPSRWLGPNHGTPEAHNDGISVSHDVYEVSTLGLSPGGVWEIPFYTWYSKDGANPNPRLGKQEVTVWCDDLPLWLWVGQTVTEAEAAAIICPTDTCLMQDPGDFDSDGTIDALDVEGLVDYLYHRGEPPLIAANADANGDCGVDYYDVIYLIEYITYAGPPPVNCTCEDPPIYIPQKPYCPDGKVKHSRDEYSPSAGDPSGTAWKELWPKYNALMAVAGWNDDGDGVLSSGDTLLFAESLTQRKFHELVEKVTPTLTLAKLPDLDDTIYVDLIEPDNPLIDPITEPIGTYWNEAYPLYSRKYKLVFWAEYLAAPALEQGNTIVLQALIGQDSAWAADFEIVDIATDVITTPLPPVGDEYDHNADRYRPTLGDPTGTIWRELYPDDSTGWTIIKWIDNGDDILSACDTLWAENVLHLDSILLKHVEDVTLTLRLCGETDTMYVEQMCGNALAEKVSEPLLTYWYSVWPDFGNRFILRAWFDDGDGYLGATDIITLADVTDLADPGESYMVGDQATDMTATVHGVPECDCIAGDADDSGDHNILDVSYIINFLYKNGPAPIPYAECSGDADCDCVINILDVTYIINYLYKNGAPPCGCHDWQINCGPLRK